MQLIRVRYYPATNHRGSRLTATNGRESLSVPYEYGNDEIEKLNVAKAFKEKFMKHAPELCDEADQYNNDFYYHFIRKVIR